MNGKTPRIGEEQAPPEERPVSPKQGRRRALRFVSVFVVLVMGLLTAYRYALDTQGNMWYLFQVARNTAWVLDAIGEKALVEPNANFVGSGKAREELAAWRGKPEPEASSTPLTPYESWLHKAHSRVRDGGTLAEHGPLVSFVLRSGIVTRRARLKAELADPAKVAERERIESDLADLYAEEDAIPVGVERNRARRDVNFSFLVVPDCGAIPSMSIYLAAVLAFPALIRQRALGAAVGLVILYGVNVARLATLALIGAVDRSPGAKWFNFVHEYVWQGIFIVFVVAVWLGWIELVVKARRT